MACITLVHDEPRIAAVLVEVLRQQGIQVTDTYICPAEAGALPADLAARPETVLVATARLRTLACWQRAPVAL